MTHLQKNAVTRRRRETRYPARLTARVTADDARRVAALADQHGVPVATVVRAVVTAGISTVADRWRRRPPTP